MNVDLTEDEINAILAVIEDLGIESLLFYRMDGRLISPKFSTRQSLQNAVNKMNTLTTNPGFYRLMNIAH